MQIVCIDDLVPQDHLLRIIDKAIDWSFIYDLLFVILILMAWDVRALTL